MFIARWSVDARFGHKQQVIDALKQWSKDIAPKIGLSPAHGQLLTGSIGALEATVEHNWQVKSLSELEKAWAELASMDVHKARSEKLEPHVVSGTSRWEVFRVT